MTSPLLLATTLCIAACGEGGRYELHWTIGCDGAGDGACAVLSARDCSQVGLDSVEVIARREGAADGERTIFPCFSPDGGAVGVGPGVGPGRFLLTVLGLSPGGQPLSGPLEVPAELPGSGAVRVDVDLPAPLACQDGVDNDGDGLVDLLDTGCDDAGDASE